jgi:dynein heavy chain
LELIKAYKSSLAKKRTEVEAQKQRYVVGLEKLDFAAQNVKTMQQELTELQPVLRESKKETNELMAKIEHKLPGVKKKQEEVGKETAAAQGDADRCAHMKADCEADLAEAIPILNDAVRSLNTLKPADINEVKQFTKPPGGVVLVMESVCVMLGVKPDKVKDPEGGIKKINDYWPPSKKLLSAADFMNRLLTYDKDNIDPKIIGIIRNRFLTNPSYTPENAKKSSNACAGLCKWVTAMSKYDHVAKIVAPKKASLAEAEAELEVVMA